MTTDKISFEQHLQKLKSDYSAQLPAKLAAISGDWQILQNQWNPELLEVFHRNIHSLIGTSGTFGFTDISKTARELETTVKPLKSETDVNFKPSLELAKQFDTTFAKLTQLVKGLTASPTIDVKPLAPSITSLPVHFSTPSQIKIYYLDDDLAAPEMLIQNLASYGFQAKHFQALSSLLAAIERDPPKLVLLDLIIPEASEQEIFNLAQQLKAKNIYVIILSSRDDFTPRLAAVRASVDAYILKPADIPAMVSTIRSMFKLDYNKPRHVIIVDDQLSVAQYYASVLKQIGIQVTIIQDPRQVTKVLENTQTDLMIFDLNMPDVSGAELAAVVRQYAQYQSIPIVFLSAEANPDQKSQLLQVGSDDLLSKDMPVDAFISQINSRLERTRQLTTLMYQDSLTGLLNHAQIQLAAERVFQHCKRKETKCVFCMIDIDRFKSINDTYGHLQGDKVIKALAHLLQQRLRTTDYIGRFGGEEFMLVLPEVSITDAGNLVNSLRLAFSKIKFYDGAKEFNSTFSAGLAENLGMGDFIDQIRFADEAMYKAKGRGRNLVCAHLPEKGNN